MKYPQLVGKYGLGNNITDLYLVNIANEIIDIPTNENESMLVLEIITDIFKALLTKENHYDTFLDMLDKTINKPNVSDKFLIKLGFTIRNYMLKERITDDEKSYGIIIGQKILEKVKI